MLNIACTQSLVVKVRQDFKETQGLQIVIQKIRKQIVTKCGSKKHDTQGKTYASKEI